METPITTPAARLDPRKELGNALVDLEKHAPSYVNLSRLRLALNGLRQKPGNESIRVAVLGLTNGSNLGKTAKKVLKLLLADPLKFEEDWEKEVEGHDLTKPIITRVGAAEPQESEAISLMKGSLLHEVNVSSATLNGHSLELLLMVTNPYTPGQQNGNLESLESSILVPPVEIPMSNTGGYTPIRTPVHKALIVADGIMGAASVAPLGPLLEKNQGITVAVNIPDYKQADESPLPFTPIDVGVAEIGLGLIRKDLKDAMEYEHLWFQSNLPKLVEWLKADVMSSEEGRTKPPVRQLIASLLKNASMAIEREEAMQFSSSAPSSATAFSAREFKPLLEQWAEKAHTELQEQLDMAFASQKWRRLSWWKLFWRVDDVGMLSTEMMSQSFLPSSERSLIYLTGQIAAGMYQCNPVLPEPVTTSTSLIPNARLRVQNTIIPHLQALAQKLVMKTLGTSGLMSSLGALIYLSMTNGLFEAGAVAALGIVWSMRRMQMQWETARKYYEDEVREIGRRAVREAEVMLEGQLRQVEKGEEPTTRNDEVEIAKELVRRADEALERME